MSTEIQTDDFDLSNEELQQMLKEKTQELIETQSELLKVQNQLKTTEIKALAVYGENNMLKASPDISTLQAEMDYHMKMAKAFIAGKAFNCETPEQAYVIIKAGSEMGLKPVESMQMLYIVKGVVKPYGDKMIGMITRLGFKITYTNESKDGVTVTISHPDSNQVYVERVTPNDDALKHSKAYAFAPKNKMRFHGVRMIISFYLPHLFMSASDEFTGDFNDFEKTYNKDENGNTMLEISERGKSLLDQVNECKSIDELEELWNDNQAIMSKDIKLTGAVKKKKIELDGK